MLEWVLANHPRSVLLAMAYNLSLSYQTAFTPFKVWMSRNSLGRLGVIVRLSIASANLAANTLMLIFLI